MKNLHNGSIMGCVYQKVKISSLEMYRGLYWKILVDANYFINTSVNGSNWFVHLMHVFRISSRWITNDKIIYMRN